MLEAILPSGVCEVEVSGLTQWDKGRTLQITCDDLPTLYQVHFAVDGSKKSYVVTVTDPSEPVPIPDELLQQPRDLVAYLYVVNSDTTGETVGAINLPVTRRAKPEDYVSDLTPTQLERIESLLAEIVNDGVDNAVLYTKQTLTASQQALARQNIGVPEYSTETWTFELEDGTTLEKEVTLG